MSNQPQTNFRNGFTLLELLIVISIIAILSVIVILVLNPSEMLKKARDSQRMADLNTIKTAIGLYTVGTTTPNLGIGGTTTGCLPGARYVWFSKSGVTTSVDTDATATSSALQAVSGKTNGSGWIPVNLSSLSGGSPISNWPVDPVNSIANLSAPAANDLVYRYSCNTANQFEVDATLESNAFTIGSDKRLADGGDNTKLYEVGTNLRLISNPDQNLLPTWKIGTSYGWINYGSEIEIYGLPDPVGGLNAVRIQSAGAPNYSSPSWSVTPNTSYTISWYIKNNGGTAASYFIIDWTHSQNIIDLTSYFNEFGTDNQWHLISKAFSTPAGCTSIRLFMFRDDQTVDALVYGVNLELAQ